MFHPIFHDVDDHTFEKKIVIRRLPGQTRRICEVFPAPQSDPSPAVCAQLETKDLETQLPPTLFSMRLFYTYSEDTAMIKKNQKEIWPYFCPILLKGGLEALEKEINENLGSKRENQFSNPFLNWYKKHVRFIFRTCFGMPIYVRAIRHCESSCRSARR